MRRSKFSTLRSLSRTASGMTLVELMISVAILALGISAVLGLNIATMNASAGAANLSRATLLAETQSEWLRTMDYNKVAFVSQSPEKLTANGLTCAEDPDTPCIFTRTTTILTGAPTSTSSTISIKVEWQNKELIYDTVVSSIGFF